jgi:hypothetical protein
MSSITSLVLSYTLTVAIVEGDKKVFGKIFSKVILYIILNIETQRYCNEILMSEITLMVLLFYPFLVLTNTWSRRKIETIFGIEMLSKILGVGIRKRPFSISKCYLKYLE